MVTGDNLETAVAIAKEAGIISSGGPGAKNKSNSSRYRCMTGPDFRREVGGLREEVGADGRKKEVIVNPIQFREIVKELRVLARSTPHDKYVLTVGLKNEGNVVAVTGDGTNDAAALRHANIGFAMGKAGTEVAKEAASIILLDDNFGSLVTSIKWGRNVYDSIRKFLQFQLTANLVAIFMALLGGVFLGDSPLNSIQMLWVNLIMDTFAAMALATEPPKEDILRGKPYPKNDRIITPSMWRNILGQSAFQVTVLSVLLFGSGWLFGIQFRRPDEPWTADNGFHYTMIFNTFIFMQVFNEINCRKVHEGEFNVFADFFNNSLFLGILGITVAVQILLVQHGGHAVRCTPLTLSQHLLCVGIGALSLVFGYLVKLIPLRYFSSLRLNEEPLQLTPEEQY